jgi:predicted AAA+ superfamily ATPase
MFERQKTRYLEGAIERFLEKKMVFLGGPRQVGKTTLCLSFLDPPTIENPAYMNWDDLRDKKALKNGELPSTELVVLDEIHKFKHWRNLVKGFYDKKKNIQKFLVTGSARLDYYRRGGDSLLGRYRYVRLHPLSVAELGLRSTHEMTSLLQFGGFPEPYFAQDETEWKLWSQERVYRIVNDDIRDLESVRDISSIELLAENLPERVGSPLSVNNIANDLSVNYRTAENWIKILERVYYCFRITPFGSTRINAVKKEKKLYLWDWSQIESAGAKFENLVACHLLKYCHFLEDTQGEKLELRFLRDLEKREIDFVVLKNKKPLFAVECKTGEKKMSEHLRYFKERTDIPMFYQVHLGERDYSPEERIRVLPFTTFSQLVGLP